MTSVYKARPGTVRDLVLSALRAVHGDASVLHLSGTAGSWWNARSDLAAANELLSGLVELSSAGTVFGGRAHAVDVTVLDRARALLALELASGVVEGSVHPSAASLEADFDRALDAARRLTT